MARRNKDQRSSQRSSATANTTSPLSQSNTDDDQPKGYFRRLLDAIHLEYYRFEVTYGVYTMTFGEKVVTHVFLLSFFALFVWAVCVYFPAAIFKTIASLKWLFTGSNQARLRDVARVGQREEL